METLKIIQAFTGIFMMLSSLIAMITGIIKYKKKPELKPFAAYAFASLAQTVILMLTSRTGYSQEIGNIVHTTSMNLFLLIEIFTAFYFFLLVLEFPITKQITRWLLVLCLSALLVYWTLINGFFAEPIKVYILESVIILIPCLFYFYEKFKKNAVPVLLQEPSFWVAFGFLLYFSCTLPFFLMESLFKETVHFGETSFINYAGYGTLFLLVTKAFLCKKRQRLIPLTLSNQVVKQT